MKEMGGVGLRRYIGSQERGMERARMFNWIKSKTRMGTSHGQEICVIYL